MDLNKNFANIPFARVFIPIIPAIIIADYFGIDISFYAFITTLIIIIFTFFYKHTNLYLLLFCFGLSLSWLQNSNKVEPYSIYDTVCVLTSMPENKEVTARIISFDKKRCDENILLLLDKHLDSTLNIGDTLSSTILIQEMFGSRVKNRKEYIYNGIDIYANIILESGYSYKRGDIDKHTQNILYDTRKFVCERLDKMDISVADKTLLKAITIGDKTDLDYSLAERYRRSGVSHLLAISGWHIGIIFLFLNIILFFMNRNFSTRIAKLIIIIAIIWFYAAITSFSASVTRAAIMFTMMQFALFGHVGINMKFNILFCSAFLLLSFDANYIYDISFQLSYMAILSIFIFYKPLISLVKTRNRVLRFIPEAMAITISAQILTLPIVIYHFGEYSMISIFSNMYMMLLMPILMILSILFIVCPIFIFEQGIKIILNMINSTMNYILDCFGGYVSGIDFDGYLVCAYYLFVVIVVVLFDRKEKIIL